MMESPGGSSNLSIAAAATVSAAMPSPSNVADSSKATNYEFDPSIAEEEKRFYVKAYPTVDIVRDRKTHCTVCKTHIGTAPVQENGIKMHPILRVTHCNKCHDFYNSGEFSKGEDGSELYCRWCGQGGEVYCCSSCPYVFCKSCIVKNLSRGVVADIEQNENWNCFSCAPKILWPLRAQHWALMNYIEQQKKEIYAMNLSETELKQYLSRDHSKCCRLAKAKCGNMSDSMESLDSIASKRSHGSTSGSAKKLPVKHAAASPQLQNAAKRAKTNDEVVCTPDLLSMLEPDCQITVSQKPNRPMPSPSATTPKIMSIQQPQASSYSSMTSTPKNTAPPPLVLRNTAIKLRPVAPQPVVRRTIIGPRTPAPGGGNSAPVYHTINGYRIDLNSAAQQETFRLPNGKLIQVKRQGPPSAQNTASPSPNNWQQMNSPQQQRIIPQTIASRPVQITQHPYNITVQHQQSQQQQQQQQGGNQQVVRQYSNMIGSTTINAVNHNGTSLQLVNGQLTATPQHQHQQQQSQQQQQTTGAPLRPVMIRHVFPDTPIGVARTGLQEQVFNAMEICTHLTNKVQTLTNSNAYKQARNYMEVKELYIHLSYLLTYAIGRFKGLQDKCLGDMRKLGFGNDADSLENGQLAAAVDYVCYGQLDDVDLFNTGSNSFHNQVYEYRKSLHANLKEGEDGAKSPLPPLFALGEGKSEDMDDEAEGDDNLLEDPKDGIKGHWLEGGEDSLAGYNQENEENEEPEESFLDNDDDEGYSRGMSRGGFGGDSFMQGTEESMRKNEETHAYDRKLTRLVAKYPSIWCTRHPDYGNFEVTRKQWRTISSHFSRNEQIKLRWKNIRKRFVRIEKRIAEGKRFNGHFDKAMAFLANRDLPEDQWVNVDCGEDDGDTYDRCNLDAIEQSLHLQGKDEFVDRTRDRERDKNERNLFSFQPAVKPIDIDSLDLKIMTFVKSNPVLWRKSMDPEADKIDEQTRKTVWNQLQRSMPQFSHDHIKDRWQHLYEMYKTFRLKTIKSHEDRANLELKYSKYLAKLYFLYKIDEDELRNENNGLFEDCFELDDDEEAEREADEDADEDSDSAPPKQQESQAKLQDMPDDKDFLLALVKLVRKYPAIWNTQHEDYNDIMIRDNYWQEINEKLQDFKHKQASDDEDNEIEIVEPKTDLITLDSDDDEPPHISPVKKQVTPVKVPKMYANSNMADVKVKPFIVHASIAPIPAAATQHQRTPQPPPQQHQQQSRQPSDDNMDLMSMAQSFLASMLEVDIHEGSYNTPGLDSTGLKKQPRKKLTSKPNPTLLKQKAIMERERLEEMKRNDQKLKMKCAVALKKAEDEFPFAKEMLDAKAKQLELYEKKRLEKEADNKLMVDDGKKLFEVEVILEDDVLNSSTEDKNTNAKDETEKVKELSKESDDKTKTENTEETLKEGDSTDKSASELSKEKDAEMETEENPDEAKDKKTVEITEKDTEKTEKDVSENPKDDSEINDEEEKDISKDETEDISEKDEVKETSLDDVKEKSMEVEDEDSEQTNECPQKEEEMSKEIEDEIILKAAKVKEKETDEDDIDTTTKEESNGEATTEKVTEEVETPALLEKNPTEKPNGIDDMDNNKDEDEEMETEDEHLNAPTAVKEAEAMEVDNEKESPQKSNISKVIDANQTPNDKADLDVDKEIEKVLQKPHVDNDDDDDDDDNVEELDNNKTETDSLNDSIDTDNNKKSPNKLKIVTTDERTSPQKDTEEPDDLTSKEQTLETPSIDAESTSTTTNTTTNNTSSNDKEEVIV